MAEIQISLPPLSFVPHRTSVAQLSASVQKKAALSSLRGTHMCGEELYGGR